MYDTQNDRPVRIALSNPFETPRELFRAWQQLQFIHTLPEVEQVQSIPLPNVQLPLTISMLEMIYKALCNANDSAARAILQECSMFLPNPENALVSDLIAGMLSNMITQLKLENPSLLLSVDVPVYIPGKQEDLFQRQFPECFKQIARNMGNKTKAISQFGRQLLAYIEEHIYDPELYIAMVADYFDISPPTIQKLIKDISGQTFLGFVEKKRLEKAREMLLAGGYTIQAVASSCGFSNYNSFLKAFKRYYGYPPGNIQSR
jgi:AraC-like DNA-binding protein